MMRTAFLGAQAPTARALVYTGPILIVNPHDTDFIHTCLEKPL